MYTYIKTYIFRMSSKLMAPFLRAFYLPRSYRHSRLVLVFVPEGRSSSFPSEVQRGEVVTIKSFSIFVPHPHSYLILTRKRRTDEKDPDPRP